MKRIDRKEKIVDGVKIWFERWLSDKPNGRLYTGGDIFVTRLDDPETLEGHNEFYGTDWKLGEFFIVVEIYPSALNEKGEPALPSSGIIHREFPFTKEGEEEAREFLARHLEN